MSRRCRISAAIVWACLLSMPTVAAPSGQFTIDVWDTDSGLPQNSIISMIRTRDGYLWLGTVNGLVRFDGVGRRMSGGVGMQFPVFDERNTPGLNSSLIIKLFEDSQGYLWIGTETAGIVRARNGKLETIDLGRGSREGRLISICEDSIGAVWLYTADGQLGRFYNGKLDTWKSGTEFPSRSRHLIVDNSKLLWVGTDRTLMALRPGSEPPISKAYDIPVGRLDFLLASGGDGYWRLANGRIQKWNRDKLERDLGAYPWNAWDTPVYAACEDRAGNLVVGTGGAGVYWFDAQGGYVHLTVTNGLSYNTILSLVSDQEGNLWVGTDGGGLNRVRQQIFKVLEPSRDLVVRSVTEDADGGIWLGYNMARVDCFKSGETISYTNTHGLIDLNVRSVFADSAGEIWAGTLGRGLLRFSQDLFLIAPETGFLRRDREVCVLFEDRRHRLWAGTSDGLACRAGGKWRTYTTRDGLGGNNIRAIAEDHEGGIWVGTDGGGLWRFADDKFSPIEVGGKGAETAETTRQGAFPASSISCLLWDTNKVLWAGTSLGVARYADGKWTFYTNEFGLSAANIGYLVEDEEGFLWLGSNLGLMRAPKAALNAHALGATNDLPVRFYGKADGMPTRETSRGSQPAALRGSNGTLWFSTIKGLISVNPRFITRNTNPPPVIIEAVAVDGQMVTSQALRAGTPDDLRIPASKENIDIYFTSLNLSAPDQGQFRYQLEGFERGTTLIPGNLRSVHYSRLPHGNYTFRLTACNEDGVWNAVGSSLAITVLPPFWKTWWFIALSVAAVLGAVAGTVHLISTQRLQRQVAELRQQEALERERARIARDLHDQLGANLTQVALLGELAETDKDQPSEVEEQARQICHTARETTRALDEIVWTVNPSNDTLEGLGNYICKYAQDYLATAEIKCRLDVPPELPATPISPELRHNVFLVAKESINNLVKHSGATEARLRLGVEEQRFTLEIEDNGKGLAPGSENKGRHGLKNMRRRMEEVGGTFGIAAGQNGGTLVSISAPRSSGDAPRA